MAKHNYKLTSRQFIKAFRLFNYNYTLTAKYIQRQYGIPYTRQAVYERAKKYEDEAKLARGINVDTASTGLMRIAEDAANDVRLRARLFIYALNRSDKYQLNKAATTYMNNAMYDEDLDDREDTYRKPVDLSEKLMLLALSGDKTLHNY